MKLFKVPGNPYHQRIKVLKHAYLNSLDLKVKFGLFRLEILYGIVFYTGRASFR